MPTTPSCARRPAAWPSASVVAPRSAGLRSMRMRHSCRSTGKTGGTTCGVRDGRLVLSRGTVDRDLGDVATMPLTVGGSARYNVANLAGAALVATVLGIAPESIARAFSQFGADPSDNMGRMMRFDVRGVTVLVDYAHNSEGIRGLLQVARQMLPDRWPARHAARSRGKPAECRHRGSGPYRGGVQAGPGRRQGGRGAPAGPRAGRDPAHHPGRVAAPRAAGVRAAGEPQRDSKPCARRWTGRVPATFSRCRCTRRPPVRLRLQCSLPRRGPPDEKIPGVCGRSPCDERVARCAGLGHRRGRRAARDRHGYADSHGRPQARHGRWRLRDAGQDTAGGRRSHPVHGRDWRGDAAGSPGGVELPAAQAGVPRCHRRDDRAMANHCRSSS